MRTLLTAALKVEDPVCCIGGILLKGRFRGVGTRYAVINRM